MSEYLTRAEMARELIWCMNTIDSLRQEIKNKDSRIEDLEGMLALWKNAATVEELPPIEEPKTLFEVFSLAEAEDETLDKIAECFDLPPRQVIAEEPVVEEPVVVNRYAKNGSKCERCGRLYTYTDTREIKEMCSYCNRTLTMVPRVKAAKKLENRETMGKEIKIPYYPGLPIYKPTPGENRGCDTCINGKFCKGSDSGFECLALKARDCVPWVLGKHYENVDKALQALQEEG